ncbi:hypothetical protein PYW08_012381 [Mythimna loreyi]|uniref:Uncharacterized protein n=1 Tax=Mythimna loreyi TaxID=667449 RepID=A0ACC2Q3L6_9NEOP|nr:hypothetical protein PYW08_012381 [Mythimna loreyi]
MEKQQICRICLVENVRMYIVNDKDLQELYETLTDIPFVTEDRRPMLACVFCFAKLKQCCQLQRKCLEAEKLFAQMLNEPNTLISRRQLKYPSGLVVTPVANIDIVDVSHIESIAVKEELPDVDDDVIEPKVELFEYELELEPQNNTYSDAEDVPAQQSEPDLEYDNLPLTKIKMEVEEEQEIPRKKRKAGDTTRAAVAKKPNLHKKGKKLEDVITEIQKKNEESNIKVTQNTPSGSSKLIAKLHKPSTNTTPRTNISVVENIKKSNITKEKPYKCEECQRSFNQKAFLTRHIRAHTGEKPYKCDVCQTCFSENGNLIRHMRTHTGEKPYKCEECQLSFSQKSHLIGHNRRHTGEKPYQCEECQLCFGQKSSLLCHIRTHTGEKPYKCNQCQLRFKQKITLLNHISTTHTGEKPFKCDRCPRSFSDRSSLTRHSRCRHVGEKKARK